MTEKQKIFANEYLIDMNATRAYKTAYKSVKRDEVAAQAGSRMLRNVNVKKYIDDQLKKIEDKSIAEATEVMQYLTKILRGEEIEEIIVVEGVGDGCSEARRMSKALNQKDRLKAAELLAKRYGLLVEKVDGKLSIQAQEDWFEPDE